VISSSGSLMHEASSDAFDKHDRVFKATHAANSIRPPISPAIEATNCNNPDSRENRNDPQPGVVQEQYPRTAMCVRIVDVHVSCSSHFDAQFAAFFIDPRAE